MITSMSSFTTHICNTAIPHPSPCLPTLHSAAGRLSQFFLRIIVPPGESLPLNLRFPGMWVQAGEVSFSPSVLFLEFPPPRASPGFSGSRVELHCWNEKADAVRGSALGSLKPAPLCGCCWSFVDIRPGYIFFPHTPYLCTSLDESDCGEQSLGAKGTGHQEPQSRGCRWSRAGMRLWLLSGNGARWRQVRSSEWEK